MTIRQALNSLAGNLVQDFDRIVLGSNFRPDAPIGVGLSNEQYLDSVEDALARLDSKAGAVLTHISMMIAAATFVISGESAHWLEKLVIGFEVAAYLMLALCCLRCLFYRDVVSESMSKLHGPGPQEYRALLRTQVITTGNILNFAIRWAFFITFIFAVSLMVHILL